MEHTRVPLQAHKYQPSGKRDIDRPKRRWRETQQYYRPEQEIILIHAVMMMNIVRVWIFVRRYNLILIVKSSPKWDVRGAMRMSGAQPEEYVGRSGVRGWRHTGMLPRALLSILRRPTVLTNSRCIVIFQVLTAASMKLRIFWDILPCS
jgi:hypothetical protein